MATKDQILIIGGGHNGLVTAYYLARAGFKPVVLEQQSATGGAARTEEFHPGFKCSTLAHWAGPLAPEIVRDMQLERHGLQIIQPEARVFAPTPDGQALVLSGSTGDSVRSIARFSRKDAAKYPEFLQTLARLAKVVREVQRMLPPSLDGPAPGDVLTGLRSFRSFRALGRKDMFRLLRWVPMAVADVVGEWFETDVLRATVAARGIFGAFAGPWSAGTGTVLLLRAADDDHPAGQASMVQGGLGALAAALTAAAREAGAQIRTGARVERILVNNGSVRGVALHTGEELLAGIIISNADPRRTFLRLLDPVHLEPSFVARIRNYLCRGCTAKVNLALAGLPSFTALASQNGDAALRGCIHIGPGIDYLEKAFDQAKYGHFSQQPYLAASIPTLSDPSLAPSGRHVLSVYMQFAPSQLRNTDWSTQREALGDVVVKTLSEYAPDLLGLILARQIITPQDLEETYGLTGGQIFHGELTLDQLFTMRPLLECARYRTLIRGLYLCGSGTHPGSGLNGLSGANAARQILKDLRA